MRSIAPVSREAQEKHEQVDEVEVKRQGAHDRVRAGLTGGHRERHGFETLRIVGGQSRKDDDADERNDELQSIASDKNVHERGAITSTQKNSLLLASAVTSVGDEATSIAVTAVIANPAHIQP